MKETNMYAGLDLDWVQLILEAKHLGIELDEIRSFLRGENTQLNLINVSQTK